MPLKTDTIEEPNLNLTPMIDIVFLLLIFFMVGSEFSELDDMKREIEVELPKTSAADPLTDLPDELVITVQESGQLSLNATNVTLPELVERLKKAKEQYAEQRVRLKGDGRVPYERVMRVLDVCKNQAGIRAVGLATEFSRQPIEGNLE